MKKLKCIFTIIFVLVIELSISVSCTIQNDKLPDWIVGTWHNFYESNTNNFVYWTFSKDSIWIEKFPIGNSTNVCLNEKFSGFVFESQSNDSICKLTFVKEQEVIIYEFKLMNVNLRDVALSYSIVNNGIVNLEHSTSCNRLLFKTEQ